MTTGAWLLAVQLLSGGEPVVAGELPMVLRTTPQGASVEIGGVVRGRTPLTLHFPTAHFRAPATIWARPLPAPIEVTFRLTGYEARTVRLGDGPHHWSSFDGKNHFTYYLLRPEYRVELHAEAQPVPARTVPRSTGYIDELRALGELRDDGVITDAEFADRKRQVLEDVARGSNEVGAVGAAVDAAGAPANSQLAVEDGPPTFVLPFPREILTNEPVAPRHVGWASSKGIDLFDQLTVPTGFADDLVELASVGFLKTQGDDAVIIQVRLSLVSAQAVARTLRVTIKTGVGDVAQPLKATVGADEWGFGSTPSLTAKRNVRFAWQVSAESLESWFAEGEPFLFVNLSTDP